MVFIQWLLKKSETGGMPETKPAPGLCETGADDAVFGGASGIRTPDLRIMIPSL
jgi:hypothetical protein